MKNKLIYVYCISNRPFEFSLNAEFKGLNCIKHNEFYTVVKLVSNNEFSEDNLKRNLSDINWVDTHAREHISIISLLMEQCTVVPFKLGTIYHTEEGLKKFINEYTDSLIKNLHNIEKKEEWSMKIYCDRHMLSKQIDKFSEEAAVMEKQIMASSPGKAFLLKRKKTEFVENEMDRICKKYGQIYYDKFKNLSDSANLNNLIPKEITGRKDTMILNANFLVRKNKAEKFKDMIYKLNKQDENSCLFIDVTGPWPPFSFVSIKEKI